MSIRNTVHAIQSVDLLSHIQRTLCGRLLVKQEDLLFVDCHLREEVITSIAGENCLTVSDWLDGVTTANGALVDCGLCKRVIMKAVSEHRERVYVRRRKKEMALEEDG